MSPAKTSCCRIVILPCASRGVLLWNSAAPLARMSLTYSITWRPLHTCCMIPLWQSRFGVIDAIRNGNGPAMIHEMERQVTENMILSMSQTLMMRELCNYATMCKLLVSRLSSALGRQITDRSQQNGN